MQTAVSNAKYAAPIKTVMYMGIVALAINPMRMCPVEMFAVRRTASVMGRTIFEISSMTHRKGVRGAGAPVGVRCARNAGVLFVIAMSTAQMYTGRANVILMAMCLVVEKM